MRKNLLKYFFTILLICGVFFVVTKLKNILFNKYYGVDKVVFSVDNSIYSSTYSYDYMGFTFVGKEDSDNSELFSDSNYVLFIDETANKVIASYNAHRRMYPASMTKLMTAIIVCDRIESGAISLDDIVTVSDYYDLTYDDVEPCDLSYGSKITIKDLMYGLLIQSNNYYALILADYVAGSEQAFCELMNKKAYELGATNTHFANPHGLDNPNHYTTANDIYLILKEADKYELIHTIDSFSTYSFTYTAAEGYEVSNDIYATNLFSHGYVSLPANFQIRTWKTGTTSGAGNCLALCLTKNDHTYYLIASDDDSREELYDLIIELLCLVE